MSHGPPRAFQPHAYPTPMPAPSHHRPPMMNAHLQTMTTVASAQPLSPAQHNQQATAAAAAAAAAAAVGGNNTSSSGGHMTGSHDSIYCDGCQNVRPASYFPGERRLDYNVCEVCRSREMQKRKQQLERYSNDVYEESQRTFKHNTRPPPPFQQYQYAHQQPHMQHLSPQSLQQQQQHLQAPAPLRMPASSPQIKPTLPLSSSMIPGMQQVNKPLFPSSLRPQVHHVPVSLPLTLPQQQQQQQTHHEFNQQSPLPSHPPPPLAQPPPRQLHDSDQQMPIRMPVIENEKPQAPPPPPQTTTPTSTSTATTATTTNRSPSKQTDTSCQDILSPEAFVYALQQETEFERKQYVVDINPLIARLGSEAGFTQLGRAICEHILAGTKFNFRSKKVHQGT
ncbi:hypothetical protein BJV82DRAFT_315875 [Fennellomyces sp. T-0311]|nr:hypothetical protein BJV82DRAFT_315875 [Fennellomyces sp. T-0311]